MSAHIHPVRRRSTGMRRLVSCGVVACGLAAGLFELLALQRARLQRRPVRRGVMAQR